MGLNRSFVSPNSSLWVIMGPYVSLRVVVGLYRPNVLLWVLMDSEVCLWVLIDFYEF